MVLRRSGQVFQSHLIFNSKHNNTRWCKKLETFVQEDFGTFAAPKVNATILQNSDEQDGNEHRLRLQVQDTGLNDAYIIEITTTFSTCRRFFGIPLDGENACRPITSKPRYCSAAGPYFEHIA